jgi:uncharacterized membrane protein YidH (DUF202 family)
MQDPKKDSDQQDGPPRPTLLQVIQSILAAAFGVQSQKARERDFTRGSPLPYIIGGVVFTVLLIVVLIVIVNMVLSGVG